MEDLRNEAFDRHYRVGEQHIDQDELGDMILKSGMKYPAIVLKLEGSVRAITLNSLKNSIEIYNIGEGLGDAYFYMKINGKTFCAGLIDLHIDEIYRIEELLSRLKPQMYYSADGEGWSKLESSSLVHTIEI